MEVTRQAVFNPSDVASTAGVDRRRRRRRRWAVVVVWARRCASTSVTWHLHPVRFVVVSEGERDGVGWVTYLGTH